MSRLGIPQRLVKYSFAVATAALLGVFSTNAPLAIAQPAAESVDLTEIPAGDAEAIVEFIQETAQRRPEATTEPADRQAFADEMSHTLIKAAENLLKAKPDQQQEALAHRVILISLDGLATRGDKAAVKRLDKEIKLAKASKNPGVVNLGWQFALVSTLENWDKLKPADKQAVVDNSLAEMQRGGLQPVHIDLIGLLAQALEDIETPYAIALLEKAVPLMEKNDDPRIRQVAERHRGTLRRLNLPGNEMEISGTLLSGDKVDWKSYRGKVVLVDFWATWCGPCREEVPNVLAMYKAYHDKGFEVLGVSLDDSREQALKYAEQMKLPWDSLFSEDPEQRGFDNPLARYYGISGIPTAILVDQEGKVVHMLARDRYLREELQRLLGDPIEPAAEKTEKQAKKPASSAESEK